MEQSNGAVGPYTNPDTVAMVCNPLYCAPCDGMNGKRCLHMGTGKGGK